MNLCIDIDGTITEPYYWLRRANEYFHTNVRPEDVLHYEMHKVLGIRREEFQQFYSRYGRLVHKESNIRYGAKEQLNRLHQNHLIHFVTAREESMRDITEEWLKDHHIPADTISLLGNPDKVWKARQLQSDYFIEDSYDNAISLAQAGFDVLLIDCTYNKGPLPDKVKRVRNWYEIVRMIDNEPATAQELLA